MRTVSSFFIPVRFFFSNFSTVISTRGLRFFVANKCASGASRLSRVEFHVSSVLTRLEKAIVFLLHQFLFSFCALSPPFFLLNGPAIYSRVNKNELPPVFKGNREITRLASKLVRLTREGGTFFYPTTTLCLISRIYRAQTFLLRLLAKVSQFYTRKMCYSCHSACQYSDVQNFRLCLPSL